MKLEKNDIIYLHTKYNEYCEQLGISIKPVFTLNTSELSMALEHNTFRRDKCLSVVRHNKPLGLTNLAKDIKLENNVIMLDCNHEQYIQVKGLHEYESIKVKKRIYIYTISRIIGHLEETLIHELIHVKYPTLRHGKRFSNKIRQEYHYNHKNETNINPLIHSIY